MKSTIIIKVNYLYAILFVGILLLSLLSFNICQAQDDNRKFIRLPVNQDLPLRITSICQDKNGLMWLGTMTSLYQYNGYSTKIFKNIHGDSTSLSNNYITAIFKDKYGEMWIGTWGGGLNRYNYETNSFVQYHNSNRKADLDINIGDVVSTIVEDRSRNMWIGTNGDGLYMIDAQRKKVLNYKNSSGIKNCISNNQVTSLFEDIHGNIWISTLNGLNMFNPILNEFTNFFHDPNDPNSINHNALNSICYDKNQRLWIGSYEGLNVYDISSNKLTSLKNTIPLPEYIYKGNIGLIKEDHNGTLWLTKMDGLYSYNSKDNKSVRYTHNKQDLYSISDNTVNAIYEDMSGVIWFGAFNNVCSLFDYKLQKVTSVLNNSSFLNNQNDCVFRIFEDHSNRVWYTNSSDGLIGLDFKANKTINISHDPLNSNTISSNVISEISRGKNGNIWISTLKGFNNIDLRTNQVTRYVNNPYNPNSLNLDLTLTIYEDKLGIIWIGTNGGGLNSFNPKTNKFDLYLHNPNDTNSISSNSVYKLFEEQSGKLFVGTSEGLDELDRFTGKFTHCIGKSDSIQSIIVLSIIESKVDSGNVLWVATSKGLFKYDIFSKKIEYYSERNGMPNSLLSGMADDDKGNLWLSAFDDLMKFNIKTETFESFDITNGLPKDEYNVKAITRSQNGRILLGGTKGLYSFHPDSFEVEPTFPHVLITDFQLFNKPVSIGKVINEHVVLKKSITETNEIKLSYLDNIISFDFSALDYRFPEKIQYAYKLDGLENDWNYIGNRHFVTYTRLSHGHYTFKVKASYKKGVWGDSYTSIRIVIKPPWWQTSLFYISVPILIIFTFYIFIIIREKNLKREKAILEKTVLERTKDLSEANTQLEEHQAELEIRQEEIAAQAEFLVATNKELEKLSIVVSKTDNAVIIMDAEANFEWVNEGFIRLFCDLETLRKERGNSLLSASQKDNIQEIFRECVESKRTVFYQTFNPFNLGKLFWTQTTLTPIINSNGDIINLIAIDSDISKLKEAEFEIINQKNELEIHRNRLEEIVIERTAELLISRDKAEESDRLKSAFLANMSHEIRTPMNAIIGFSSLLTNEELDSSERRDYISYIINNSNSLLNLIDDIIDISKIESGQLRISIRPCNLNKLMHEILDTFNYKQSLSKNPLVELRLANIHENFEFTIQTDALRVKQVLSNLIDNAFKFTEQGFIEFGYFVEDNQKLKFFVQDSGIGISESQQARIFNRFTKIDEDKTKLYRGAGLGLSICKSIITLMGGEIFVDSEINNGSTFTFIIPLIKGVDREDIAISNEMDKREFNWSDKVLLIAEDEEGNYKYVEKIFRNTKVKLLWAMNGREAIDLFMSSNPDLILMDIKMPIMDGVEATKKIRNENKTIPIIALSAYAFNQEIEEIRKEGFNDYLVKPISPIKLLTLLDGYFNQ